MKKINEFYEVQEAGVFTSIKSGLYVGIIKKVEDVGNMSYLKIDLDIFEGDYKDYYQDLYDNKGFWGLTLYRSYQNTALSYFKRFILGVENSNNGYSWNWEEKTLVNKKIGLVLQEVEYEKQDGSIGTRMSVVATYDVDEIKQGKDKQGREILIPEKKKLEESETMTISNTLGSVEIPF